MTRDEAKRIALALCSPLKEKTFDPLTLAAMQLQADYARRVDEQITDFLQEIMQIEVGVERIMRAHDEVVIEATESAAAEIRQILNRHITHGFQIPTPQTRPLVLPG